MTRDKPPTYTPAPELPDDPELRRRFTEIVAVLAQTQSVSAAARSLDLSRNHFQTILHRTIAAMLEAITPKPAGRPARPAREAELEAENQKLREDNEALAIRVEAIERMLKVVGGYASGKTPLPRSRSKKTKPEDPEPARIRKEAVIAMREQGAPTRLCVAALGVSPATVRRCSKTAPAKTKPPRAVDEAACQRVRSVVRATHGLVGAAMLGKMSQLPRRICAGIKRRELREMELERKARCATVTVAKPGVIRGFDAMHVNASEGKAYWLVAADAAIPYRTSIATVQTYDAKAVIAALAADFEINGAPLVVRLDRIACQRTPEVDELLTQHLVLALHGPPRHPYFYGQLERQNREHRGWYVPVGIVSLAELAVAGEAMRTSLNTLWPRPTLDGCTAEHVWRRRQPLDVNRRELISEVERCTSGLVTSGIEQLRARRIAIESALTRRGLLTVNMGERC
jgi:transposase InsO family protein/transposase